VAVAVVTVPVIAVRASVPGLTSADSGHTNCWIWALTSVNVG
jgi:hypothetical protein